jgi:hypothetical protein
LHRQVAENPRISLRIAQNRKRLTAFWFASEGGLSLLNLVVSAIVHWNTVYLSRATAHLRQQGRHIPDELLKHVSPLSWEHINLTGIYSWDAEQQMPDGFRELRFPGRILRAA